MKNLKSMLHTAIFVGCLVLLVIGLYALPKYAVRASVKNKTEIHEHEESRYEMLNKQAHLKNAALRKTPPDPSVTDEVAYGIALRLVGDSKTDVEKQLKRTYMANNLGVTDVDDQNLLFQISETYKRNSNLIQINAENITRKYHPTHSTISNADNDKIKELGKNKEKLVKDVVKDLKRDMSSSSWTAFQTAVLGRIKSNIKANVH